MHIKSPNRNLLQSDLNIAFAQLNKWFDWNFPFSNFQICYSWILTEPISKNLVMQVNAPQSPNRIQLQSDLNIAFAQQKSVCNIICYSWILTKSISHNLGMQVNAPQLQK